MSTQRGLFGARMFAECTERKIIDSTGIRISYYACIMMQNTILILFLPACVVHKY